MISFLQGPKLSLQEVQCLALQKLKNEELTIESVEIVYAVNTINQIEHVEASSISKFKELLDLEEISLITDDFFSALSGKQIGIFVFPRRGIQSPWSSKALDIISSCNINEITALEKGFLYRIRLKGAFLTQFVSKKVRDKAFTFIKHSICDPLTEEFFLNEKPDRYFKNQTKVKNDLSKFKRHEIPSANTRLGLALTAEDIKYLQNFCEVIDRPLTELELMMFSQVNSEHCRHKIFNSVFHIDGVKKDETLFDMIKNTYKKNPDDILVAYTDNAAVLQRFNANVYSFQGQTFGKFSENNMNCHLVFKAETHNHPTGISPYPGAATGSGGEIRDEGATGVGAKPLAGFAGFTVSSLKANSEGGRFNNRASPLEIMIRGPLGSADFNNEFGRPVVCGYFRSFELTTKYFNWGYDKPIMLAGGIGLIHETNVRKKNLDPDDLIVILGGPGFKIGVGGGAASSMFSGVNDNELDFKSVQRGNAEMQRRAQEVISACANSPRQNPIKSIHDVGAGGLANAIPELLYDSKVGGVIYFHRIPVNDSSMSPMEVWCNEAQERYIVGLKEKNLKTFSEFCEREKCPYSIVGKVIMDMSLKIDFKTNNSDINKSYADTLVMPLSFLFDHKMKLERHISRVELQQKLPEFEEELVDLDSALDQVLAHPTVASKNFLVTIADRSVGGLTARDQMVGPWQTPVSNVSVILKDFKSYSGFALALGERPPVAILDVPSSVRLSFGELFTNILAAPIESLSDVTLCANWMAACSIESEEGALYQAVDALRKICLEFGVAIPVGKDSLSMTSKYGQHGKDIISPVTLNLSGVAKVNDAREVWTPQLERDVVDSVLVFIDLSGGQSRLGASIHAICQQSFNDDPPDLDSLTLIKSFHKALKEVREFERNLLKKFDSYVEFFEKKLIYAYHDRSDGGLITTLCEMAFAGRVGINVNLDLLTIDSVASDWGDFKIRTEQVGFRRNELTLRALFNEELGVVIQTSKSSRKELLSIFRDCGLGKYVYEIGTLNNRDEINIFRDAKCILKKPRSLLQKAWFGVSKDIAFLRDNSEIVETEEKSFSSIKSPEKIINCSFYEINSDVGAGKSKTSPEPKIEKKVSSAKPKVAVLRNQGTNGQVEMAAAFSHVGFEVWDVHMTDILDSKVSLTEFDGLAISGGFSYGDVLGAGKGWAKSILFNEFLKCQFKNFFSDKTKFVLGVCNGCQFLNALNEILPGAEIWPSCEVNLSGRFESRQSIVEILPTKSIFLKSMAGSIMPITVAHAFGRFKFPETLNADNSVSGAMRFVDMEGNPAANYPENPNGSPNGLTAFTSKDGRITSMMPHPERCFRNIQLSWVPRRWSSLGDSSPWLQVFENAFIWTKKL